MRAALYARVSTRDKGQDTENQLLQLREYCHRQQWEIVGEYIDHETGRNSRRDAFQRLFEDASKRQFDIVVVWALDRFTREGVYETFEHVRRLKLHGVEFESFTEAHFRTTGPAGDLMLAIAAWIAKQESIRLSDRTKAGIERARSQGKRIGRPRRIVDRVQLGEWKAQGLSMGEISRRTGISTRTIGRRIAAVQISPIGSLPPPLG